MGAARLPGVRKRGVVQLEGGPSDSTAAQSEMQSSAGVANTRAKHGPYNKHFRSIINEIYTTKQLFYTFFCQPRSTAHNGTPAAVRRDIQAAGCPAGGAVAGSTGLPASAKARAKAKDTTDLPASANARARARARALDSTAARR